MAYRIEFTATAKKQFDRLLTSPGGGWPPPWKS
jgi:hypothetical protein